MTSPRKWPTSVYFIYSDHMQPPFGGYVQPFVDLFYVHLVDGVFYTLGGLRRTLGPKNFVVSFVVSFVGAQ